MAETKTTAATDAELDKVTKSTGDILKTQPKVKVRLPLEQKKRQELEQAQAAGKKVEWPYQVVQINGYIYQIQLGQSVEVPESVAEVLEQSGLI
jgi:hypothetical protein